MLCYLYINYCFFIPATFFTMSVVTSTIFTMSSTHTHSYTLCAACWALYMHGPPRNHFAAIMADVVPPRSLLGLMVMPALAALFTIRSAVPGYIV